MTISALNQRYGVANQIRFFAGPNDFPIAEIVNDLGTAQVALHGAHVMRFTPKGHRPVLWFSDDAIFKDGSALRGGIPVIWPWFGAHPSDKNMSSHGFVRNYSWQIVAVQTTNGGPSTIRFQYSDSEMTRALYPHPFRLNLNVVIGKELTVTLAAENPGSEPFQYTAALHSYFAVSDVREISVMGLDGVDYLDKPTRFTPMHQQGDVTFNGEVDRVYQATPDDCLIVDNAWERQIRVAKKGSQTTVVWNPGPEVVKGMADFADEQYTDMVCVETANAHDEVVTVPAGGRAELTTIISAETLS